MAAVRGRSVRSRNAKGRYQNEEEAVRLDYRKGPGENLREILVQLSRSDVSKARKLGYFNAFVRLRYRFGLSLEQSFSKEEILVCLRHGLFHRAKEIRAACLRALRYFCHDWESVEAILKLHVDFLIIRSIDICLDNELERVHAMRLIRKILSICPDKFPPSLLSPLISIANDGYKLRDKFVKTCLATICELALHNAKLVARYGGIGAILHNVLECHQLPRVNESLMATVLHLLNHPRTRPLVKQDVDLEKMLAPFTDFDYKYSIASADASDQSGEESEFRYDACKMALATIIKSWPGLIRLCKPDAPGLQSLIGMLYLPNMDTRKEIMDVLFDVFRLSAPVWTDNYSQALVSIDPSEMNETWKLTDGFTLEEGKSLLPHLAQTRPNLVDNHMAIVLSAFISAGLLEAICETITTSNQYVSVRATILLGELLHLSTTILPDVTNHYHQCLPTLVEQAANFNGTSVQQSQAEMAIACLAHLHAMKRRGPRPCSLYLAQLIECVQRHPLRYGVAHQHQLKLPLHPDKDRDHDLVSQAVRDSQVLYTKDNRSWDWDLVTTLLKWPNETMKRLEDQQHQRFVRRLVFLFKPSKKVFSVIELLREDVRKITLTGLDLIEFLTTSDSEEGQKNLKELLTDVKECLNEVVDQRCSREMLFSPSSLMQTCSQYYFLFIGKMSSFFMGNSLLEQMQIYEILINLMKPTTHDMHVKLITSCLDYSRSNQCRAVLLKGLTCTSDAARLYLTGFMRTLLRMRLSSFSTWGIEALVNQLSDQSKPVAMEAMSVLSEACEDLKNLSALIRLPLHVSHLGHKGDLMFARFLSVEEGFKVFSNSDDSSQPNFVTRELEKWHSYYNLKYIQIVEERLTEALTTYEKTYDGSYVRRSHRRVPRKDVFVPVHLYGQLVQHEKGAQRLAEEPYLADLFDALRYLDLKTDVQVSKVKAALWAVGHIGTSIWGIALLQQNDVIPTIIKLAEDSGVFTIRGTAVYVLGLIASTSKGAEVLHEFGWESVRHARIKTDFEAQHFADHLAEDFENEREARFDASRQIYPPVKLESDNSDRVNSSAKVTQEDNVMSKSRLADVRKDHLQAVSQDVQEQFSTGTEDLDNFNTSGHLVSNTANLNVQGKSDLHPSSSALICTSETGDNVLDGNAPNLSCSLAKKASSRPDDSQTLRMLNEVALSTRKSCSDVIGGSNGITFYESGTDTPGVASQAIAEPMVCSSLDTAKQAFLGLETVTVSDSSENLRHSANLRPIPEISHSRSSRTLPCATAVERRQLYLTTKDCLDQRLFTSSQDLEGYATLRELKPPRTNNKRDTFHNLRPTSLAHNYMLKTRSLDFRYSKARASLRNIVLPKVNFRGKLSSCVGLQPLRTVSVEDLGDDDVRVPMTSLISFGAPDVKSDKSSTSLSSSQPSGRPEYQGICVPVDISMIFQVNEGEDIRSQVTDSDSETAELTKSKYKGSRSSRQNSLSHEDTGCYLDYHHKESCLGCYHIRQTESPNLDTNDDQGELADVFSTGDIPLARNPPFNQKPSSRKCSSTDAPGGSVTSQTSAESVTVEKELLSENTTFGKTMISKEVLRLVVSLSSSVGVKSTEQSLLIMKQKFPTAFHDLCLYSEVCLLLNNYSFRLGSRRFVQELFQDLNFDKCMEDPQNILGIPEDYLIKFSEQFEIDHHLHQVLEC